jgi:phosphoribosyl-AMP cyclohydrolase
MTKMDRQTSIIDSVHFNSAGLVPAIVQDAESGRVLMMAWMDRAGLEKTIETGETWFYSRSRKESWHKGGTSGHIQKVISIQIDCDGDTLLIMARQVGGACHNGYFSCFYRTLDASQQSWSEAESTVFDPESAYKS